MGGRTAIIASDVRERRSSDVDDHNRTRKRARELSEGRARADREGQYETLGDLRA